MFKFPLPPSTSVLIFFYFFSKQSKQSHSSGLQHVIGTPTRHRDSDILFRHRNCQGLPPRVPTRAGTGRGRVPPRVPTRAGTGRVPPRGRVPSPVASPGAGGTGSPGASTESRCESRVPARAGTGSPGASP